MSHPIGFSIKAATAARRQRRPGGGPERSEGIAVSPKEIKRGAFFATRFNEGSIATKSDSRFLIAGS